MNIEKIFLDISIYSLIISFFLYFFTLAGGKHFQNKFIEKIPGVFVWVSFLGLLFSFTIRSCIAGFLAISNLYESIILFTALLLGSYIIVELKFNFKKMGGIVVFFALLWLFWAATLDPTIPQLPAALKSYWRSIHVPPLLTSYGLFSLSFIASIGYFIALNNAQKKEPEISLPSPSHAQLPSVKKYTPTTSILYAEIAYRCIAFGIPLLAFGIVTGAIWANESWGTYWSWDPKESMALVTLIGYTLYLHLKIQGLAKTTTLAYMAIGCFILVLLTYIGVNMLDFGLHSYGRLT